jgi:hypothetical protein
MIDGRTRQSADPRHQSDAAPSQRPRFQCHKTPAALLVQNRSHLTIALACGTFLLSPNHPTTLCRETPLVNPTRKLFFMCAVYDSVYRFESVIYGRALSSRWLATSWCVPALPIPSTLDALRPQPLTSRTMRCTMPVPTPNSTAIRIPGLTPRRSD